MFFPSFLVLGVCSFPAGQRAIERMRMTTFLFTEDRNFSQSLYIEQWWLLVMDICSPFFPKIIGEVGFSFESFFMKINAVLPFWRCIYYIVRDVLTKCHQLPVQFFFGTNPKASQCFRGNKFVLLIIATFRLNHSYYLANTFNCTMKSRMTDVLTKNI